MSKMRGFENVARRISQKQGIPIGQARAILASRTRGASSTAKKNNPRLNRVKG